MRSQVAIRTCLVSAGMAVALSAGIAQAQVKVKLEASGDSGGAGVFRVVGRATIGKGDDAANVERAAAFNDDRHAHRHTRLWLTVGAK